MATPIEAATDMAGMATEAIMVMVVATTTAEPDGLVMREEALASPR
jgi:hypothetical protein